MNLYSLKDGLILGLTAITGVFLVLAVIGLILYLFELLFYRKSNEENISIISSPEITVRNGISEKVVAAISAAVSAYLTGKNKRIVSIKIKKHEKINKTYDKLKLKEWKNG